MELLFAVVYSLIGLLLALYFTRKLQWNLLTLIVLIICWVFWPFVIILDVIIQIAQGRLNF